ncbi:phage major tail protein, TP901-1 family [Bacillus paranthracis]|uniref:phage major tail protein, TP901-1 family n=1 Tax=Bacillus paranthracis TaxID=2026186 RepID=UPI000BFC2190|nr:phage major tail protein, TP901-1 family [Bacillus paranthracis]MBE7117265.1 phage major tail protein, TP901-1 family [Bacillus paranthracis]MBE7134879.1 phage major tail protein, TP901-1 family [Bacillus paranthracis]MBE7156367.1 phage major tail protein, TP901-1 family [Bacillus paranthracis]PGZ29499.1 phage major tail protein, TP901-1 family [Bacillus anthracis]
MSGQKIAGVDVLLKAKVDGASTASVIGGQSGATLTRSANIISVTSKDSDAWEESIAGTKSWSVDCDGFMAKDDTALLAIEKAWEDRKPLDIELAFNGQIYTGTVYIGELGNEFPQDDAVTFSISLTGTGALKREKQAVSE